jgi:hypothetical protein
VTGSPNEHLCLRVYADYMTHTCCYCGASIDWSIGWGWLDDVSATSSQERTLCYGLYPDVVCHSPFDLYAELDDTSDVIHDLVEIVCS